MSQSKLRGFEEVIESKKQYGETIIAHGNKMTMYPKTILPIRADKGSAGYDFYTPVDVTILPREKTLVWTNVKAYMQPDEVLQLFVRSSVGIKHNTVLANGTGIVDMSYYSNQDNDGNIGICLRNHSGQTVIFRAGERIAQGIFTKFLVADEDNTLKETRDGGIGSSNN